MKKVLAVSIARRKQTILSCLVGTLCLMALFIVLDRTVLEHKRRMRVSDSIRERIDQLVVNTPSGLSSDEWAAAVLWTDHLHCNCMLPFQLTLKELRELDGDVALFRKDGADMQTIERIWNRYAELTPKGHRYRERFRSQMFEYVDSAREHGDVTGDYASFRAWITGRQVGALQKSEQTHSQEPAAGSVSNGKSSPPAQ